MTLRATILGCGTSGGTPRIGGGWDKCDPTNPKNIRRRCSLLVQREGPGGITSVLVDTSPDMRQQLIDVGVGRLDGVLFTHDHADHTHGIDDLRVVAFNMRRKVDVYFDEPTGAALREKFAYCFHAPASSAYPPVLFGHDIRPGLPVPIGGSGGVIAVLPFQQRHGGGHSLGYRFGGIAYSPDVSDFPDETLPHLADLDVWIVDALRRTYHPSHLSVDQCLAWIDRIRPRRAVLTHMHGDLDYETLRQSLPNGVEPAFDGMVIESTLAENAVLEREEANG